MNNYLAVVDFLGNKVAIEVVAHNEKHAKKKIISQSLKFDKISVCEQGALERLKKIQENKLQTEKTNENEIHTTS